jgi:hypothetical protein
VKPKLERGVPNMTYMLKAFIVALIGATAFTAQMSMAYAMGSDREPNTTNMIIRSSSQEYATPQKNTVFTFSKTRAQARPLGKKSFSGAKIITVFGRGRYPARPCLQI